MTSGHPENYTTLTDVTRGWKALCPEHLVLMIDNGRNMQVLVGIDATNNGERLLGLAHAVILSCLRSNMPRRKECADRTVMRPSGQAFLG